MLTRSLENGYSRGRFKAEVCFGQFESKLEDKCISEYEGWPPNTPKAIDSMVILSLNLGITIHWGSNGTVLFAAKLPVVGKDMVKSAILTFGLQINILSK